MSETIAAAMVVRSTFDSPVVFHAIATTGTRTGNFRAGRFFSGGGSMGLDVNTLFLVTIYVEVVVPSVGSRNSKSV